MDPIISIRNNEELFSPPTLQEMCTWVCVAHAKILLLEPVKAKNGKESKLRKSALLPVKIWEDILENYDRKSVDYLTLVTAINGKASNGLRKLNFSGCSTLTDSDLGTFMKNCPYSLDIHNCTSLTKKAVGVINEFGKNLESLHIGNSSHILPIDINGWMSSQKEAAKPQGFRKRLAKSINSITQLFKKEVPENNLEEDEHGLLQLPNLRRLVIWDLQVTQRQELRLPQTQINQPASTTESGDNNPGIVITIDYWDYLMRDFIHKLEYLDLSGCQDLTNLNFLLKTSDNLRTLRMHDVLFDYNERTWGVLRNLPKVTFLDVSQYSELASVFPNPDTVLGNIVSSLPNLSALDISGTNLAGLDPENSSKCSIKGLSSRVDSPLHFLGLLTTHHKASNRPNIPALKVAGTANMEQIVTALRHYLPKAGMSRKVLRILQDKLIISRTDDFVPCRTLLQLLSQVMKIHIDDKHILIVTLASTFHLVKRIYNGIDEKALSDQRTHRIVGSIITIMNTYTHDLSILRNGMLLFLVMMSKLNFKMDASIAEDLAVTLLTTGRNVTTIIFPESQLTFFMESVTHLLCCILNCGPIVLAQLRSLQVMRLLCELLTQLMNVKLFSHLPIFLMILYRVTDSCHDPLCCDLFLKTQGVGVCFRYIKMCGENAVNEGQSEETIEELFEAQIPVIGLLANLISFPQAECQIINRPYIEEVLKLFDRDRPEGLATELLLHVTCGFLANVVLKKASYSLPFPPRADILAKMTQVMLNMESSRALDFTFRNLSMLYEMLESQDAPPVQFWALRTLEQLMNAEPEKFCTMLAKDARLTTRKLDELAQKNNSEFKMEVQNMCNSLITKINSYSDVD